jgi:hypothetical protein
MGRFLFLVWCLFLSACSSSIEEMASSNSLGSSDAFSSHEKASFEPAAASQ